MTGENTTENGFYTAEKLLGLSKIQGLVQVAKETYATICVKPFPDNFSNCIWWWVSRNKMAIFHYKTPSYSSIIDLMKLKSYQLRETSVATLADKWLKGKQRRLANFTVN